MTPATRQALGLPALPAHQAAAVAAQHRALCALQARPRTPPGAPVYRLELHRHRLLERAAEYTVPDSARRRLDEMISACGTTGMVVVLRDGREISPQTLRDAANAQKHT